MHKGRNRGLAAGADVSFGSFGLKAVGRGRLTARQIEAARRAMMQYRVTDPQKYLFSVTSPDDSLRQATDSALRGVIGKYTMDRIL
ncbi:ribosomal protein L16, partial [Salmonella enterica subsp. enterica serovar Kentucky]|nr:ribosomal protein L16 [Salmonella enterica subsp. enterica serovar Kentucky]